jgi:hypothetical protein
VAADPGRGACLAASPVAQPCPVDPCGPRRRGSDAGPTLKRDRRRSDSHNDGCRDQQGVDPDRDE